MMKKKGGAHENSILTVSNISTKPREETLSSFLLGTDGGSPR